MQPGDPLWPVPSSPAASAIMRANRWRDTQPEVLLRSDLHRRGLRFRKRFTIRLGDRRWTQPDVVFTRVRVAVFVDGCFWHSCPEHGQRPAANASYWGPKLERNVRRDRDTDERLENLGWTVLRAWEHEPPASVADRVEELVLKQLAQAAAEPRVAARR